MQASSADNIDPVLEAHRTSHCHESTPSLLHKVGFHTFFFFSGIAKSFQRAGNRLSGRCLPMEGRDPSKRWCQRKMRVPAIESAGKNQVVLVHCQSRAPDFCQIPNLMLKEHDACSCDPGWTEQQGIEQYQAAHTLREGSLRESFGETPTPLHRQNVETSSNPRAAAGIKRKKKAFDMSQAQEPRKPRGHSRRQRTEQSLASQSLGAIEQSPSAGGSEGRRHGGGLLRQTKSSQKDSTIYYSR